MAKSATTREAFSTQSQQMIGGPLHSLLSWFPSGSSLQNYLVGTQTGSLPFVCDPLVTREPAVLIICKQALLS